MSQFVKGNEKIILKQGWLEKQGGSRGFGFKTWKRRWFVVTTEGVSYFKSDVEYNDGKNEYGYLHMDSSFEIRDHSDSSSEYFVFVNATRTLLCRARSQQEKVEWFSAVKNTNVSGGADSVQSLIKNLGRPQLPSSAKSGKSLLSPIPLTAITVADLNEPMIQTATYPEVPLESPEDSELDFFTEDDLEHESAYDFEYHLNSMYDQQQEASNNLAINTINSRSSFSAFDSISHCDDPSKTSTTISFSSPRSMNEPSSPYPSFLQAQSPHSITTTRMNRNTSIYDSNSIIAPVEKQLKFHSRSTREGYMYKTGSNVQSLRARYFVLLPDRLEYYKSHLDRRPKGSIPLTIEGSAAAYETPDYPHLLDGEVGSIYGYNGPKEGEVHPKPKDENDIVPPIKATWCFFVKPQPNGRSYLIFTHSKADMEAWLAAIHGTKTVKVKFPKRVASISQDVSTLSLVSEILSNTESRLALLGMAKISKQEGPVLLWIDIVKLIECPEGSREFFKASQDIYEKFMKKDAEYFLAFPDELVTAIRVPLEAYLKLQSEDTNTSVLSFKTATNCPSEKTLSLSARISRCGLKHELFHPLAAVVMYYIQQNLLQKYLLLDPGRVSDLAEEEFGLQSSFNDYASIEFLFQHLVSVSAGNEAGADAEYRHAFFLNYPAFTSAYILKRFLFKAFEDADLEYESQVTAVASRTIIVSLFQEWLSVYPRDFTRAERLDLFIWLRRWYVSICKEQWASLELPTVVQKRIAGSNDVDINAMGLSPESVLAIALYKVINMSPPALGGAFEPDAFEISKITCFSKADDATLREIQNMTKLEIISKYPSLVSPDLDNPENDRENVVEFTKIESSVISNSNITSKPSLFNPMNTIKGKANNTSKAKWLLGFAGQAVPEPEDETPTEAPAKAPVVVSSMNQSVFGAYDSTIVKAVPPTPKRPQPKLKDSSAFNFSAISLNANLNADFKSESDDLPPPPPVDDTDDAPPPPPEEVDADDFTFDLDELTSSLNDIPLPDLPNPTSLPDAPSFEQDSDLESVAIQNTSKPQIAATILSVEDTNVDIQSGSIFTISTGTAESTPISSQSKSGDAASTSAPVPSAAIPKGPRPPSSPPPAWVLQRHKKRNDAICSIMKHAKEFGSSFELKPLVPERPQRPKLGVSSSSLESRSTDRKESQASNSDQEEVSVSNVSGEKDASSSYSQSRTSLKGASLSANLNESFPVNDDETWHEDSVDKSRMSINVSVFSPNMNDPSAKPPPKIPVRRAVPAPKSTESPSVTQTQTQAQAQTQASQIPVGSAPSSLTNQSFVPDQKSSTAATTLVRQRPVYNGPPIVDLNSKAFAQELTRVDQDNLRDISLREFIGKAWIKQPKLAPNVNKMIDIFNQRSRWVSSEILTNYDASARQNVIRFFVDVAYECFRMHNFYSAFSIYSGLSLSQVFRLKYDWSRLSSATMARVEQLKQTFDSARNYRAYRRLFRAGLGKPQIPHLAIICRDCFQIEEVFANKIARAQRLEDEKREAEIARQKALAEDDGQTPLAIEPVKAVKAPINPFEGLDLHAKTMIHFAKYSQQWHELRGLKRCQATPYKLPTSMYPPFMTVMQRYEERSLTDDEMWLISYSIEARNANR